MLEVCHNVFPVALVWFVAYVVAVGGSGVVVRRLLAWGGQEIPSGQKNAGAVIGKLENILIVTFVAAGAYTALAVVFAAKSLVRNDNRAPGSPETQGKGSYYVLGTLGNLAWSLLIALFARILLGWGISMSQ